jgi:hypothetical protein
MRRRGAKVYSMQLGRPSALPNRRGAIADDRMTYPSRFGHVVSGNCVMRRVLGMLWHWQARTEQLRREGDLFWLV